MKFILYVGIVNTGFLLALGGLNLLADYSIDHWSDGVWYALAWLTLVVLLVFAIFNVYILIKVWKDVENER